MADRRKLKVLSSRRHGMTTTTTTTTPSNTSTGAASASTIRKGTGNSDSISTKRRKPVAASGSYRLPLPPPGASLSITSTSQITTGSATDQAPYLIRGEGGTRALGLNTDRRPCESSVVGGGEDNLLSCSPILPVSGSSKPPQRTHRPRQSRHSHHSTNPTPKQYQTSNAISSNATSNLNSGAPVPVSNAAIGTFRTEPHPLLEPFLDVTTGGLQLTSVIEPAILSTTSNSTSTLQPPVEFSSYSSSSSSPSTLTDGAEMSTMEIDIMMQYSSYENLDGRYLVDSHTHANARTDYTHSYSHPYQNHSSDIEFGSDLSSVLGTTLGYVVVNTHSSPGSLAGTGTGTASVTDSSTDSGILGYLCVGAGTPSVSTCTEDGNSVFEGGLSGSAINLGAGTSIGVGSYTGYVMVNHGDRAGGSGKAYSDKSVGAANSERDGMDGSAVVVSSRGMHGNTLETPNVMDWGVQGEMWGAVANDALHGGRHGESHGIGNQMNASQPFGGDFAMDEIGMVRDEDMNMAQTSKVVVYNADTDEPRLPITTSYQYQSIPSTIYQNTTSLYPAILQPHHQAQHTCRTLPYHHQQQEQPQPQPSYLPPNTSHPADAPWSPLAPQVPIYSPGYVAFLPSPGPNYPHSHSQSPKSSQGHSRASSTAHSPQTQSGQPFTPHHNPRTTTRSTASSRSGSAGVSKGVIKSASKGNLKGKGKAKDMSMSIARERGREDDSAWEHTTVSKGGLQFVSENFVKVEVDAKAVVDVRSGIRKGKLDPEVAEKARRIRRMKACWNCWIQKVPCSEDMTCERCTKLFSPIADQLCCRTGFKEYEATFFPDYLHTHFKKSKIESLISEHTLSFTNTTLLISLSTGSLFKPMTLIANIFKPKTLELIRHASLVSQPGQDSQLVERYSAPVGILGLSQSEMRKLCEDHIEDMIANPEYAAQVTVGDETRIVCEVLEVVREFCAGKDIPLIRTALKLHAIHYFMSTLTTFTPATSTTLSQLLNNPHLLREPYLSSRLLNRQIKHSMHKLHRTLTVSLLESLERSLRTRTRDSWAPSFCTILILTLCIENLQTSADTMVVCDMLKRGSESDLKRELSWRVVCALEEWPFGMSKRLFHDIFKSHKEVLVIGGNGGDVGGMSGAGTGGSGQGGSRNGGRDGGFNPLRDVRDGKGWGEVGLDGDAERMVRGIWGVVEGHWEEMASLSQRPSTIEFGYTVKPKDIKTNNTGRLASDFLRSFFPETP